MTFLPKKLIFPQNAPAYRARFWLFCPIIHCVFTQKIPKKIIFPKIMPIIQGTLLTFLPKKVIFSSKCACISSTILTFLPNNPLCFYTKNFQKVNFTVKESHLNQGSYLGNLRWELSRLFFIFWKYNFFNLPLPWNWQISSFLSLLPSSKTNQKWEILWNLKDLCPSRLCKGGGGGSSQR